MRPGKTVGMKDVAKRAGVSIVTVSNALAGKSGLSEEVRKKIKDVAGELGYVYTPKKTSGKEEITEKTALTIGVFSLMEYIKVGGSFYWELYQKTAYAASKQQCMTLLEAVGDQGELSERLQLLRGKMLDGLIVIGYLGEDYIRAIEESLSLPMIFLDFCDGKGRHTSILSSDEQGMYESARELVRNGHKHIGFVGDYKRYDNIRKRYEGYKRCLEEYGLELNDSWVLNDRIMEKGKRKIVLPDELPGAFCCSSDLTAGLLYDALRERGLKVPDDISVCGYDDYLFSHPLAGKLTTYHVDTDEMARQAIISLRKEIHEKTEIHTEKNISGYIIRRSSIKRFRSQ